MNPIITDDMIREKCKKEGYRFNYSFIKSTTSGRKERYMNVTHLKCNKTYDCRITKFITENQRCTCSRKIKNKEKLISYPVCDPDTINMTSYEQELFNEIKSFYDGEISKNFSLNNKELDIYIPSKKFGIEIDDLYWHSTKFKEKNFHIDKTKFFAENGIRVLHIFEDEWLFKKNIVMDKIKNILGLTSCKIPAKRCVVVKNISSEVKNEFLNNNHIQGEDKSDIKYALEYEGEIVAVMTMKKFTFRGNNRNIYGEKAYELTRYATKLGTSVVGGFSKLLNHILKDYNIEKIISYGDIRIIDINKNMYSTNGFTLNHITAPNYFYVNGVRRLSKYSYRKSELKKKYPNLYNDNLTEQEIMQSLSFLIIYDCGLACYIMDIKK